MTNEERQTLLKALKQHYGSLTEIARREGVTLKYVSEVLRGRDGGISTRILTTAAEVLTEYEERREQQQEHLAAALLRAKLVSQPA